MMSNSAFRKKVKHIYIYLFVFFGILLIGSVGIIYKIKNPSFLSFPNEDSSYINVSGLDKIENGIHQATGLKDDEGLQTVILNCTPCHSAKLVSQNRATKAGWIGIIRWMQDTQNLWDLGENETIIINYLAKNYAPEEKGRREVLKDIEWYNLED